MSSQGLLLSVNVGTPRRIEWRGTTMVTSIFKMPVSGRVAVRGVNVVGDEQADLDSHGGPDQAVYAYASEDYAWWSAHVGADIEPGRFGENLTTRGIDASNALVGERWRIGSALFEVASPRIPCSRLAMRMDDPGFVKRFARALRLGAYLRIVEEGDIGAGDAVTVLERPARSITIADIARIYYDERSRANELLAVERLPASWRSWAEEHI